MFVYISVGEGLSVDLLLTEVYCPAVRNRAPAAGCSLMVLLAVHIGTGRLEGTDHST